MTTLRESTSYRLAQATLLVWLTWAALYGFDHQLALLGATLGLVGTSWLILSLMLATVMSRRHPRGAGLFLIATANLLVVVTIHGRWVPDHRVEVVVAGLPLLAAGILLRPWRGGSSALRGGIFGLVGLCALLITHVLGLGDPLDPSRHQRSWQEEDGFCRGTQIIGSLGGSVRCCPGIELRVPQGSLAGDTLVAVSSLTLGRDEDGVERLYIHLAPRGLELRWPARLDLFRLLYPRTWHSRARILVEGRSFGDYRLAREVDHAEVGDDLYVVVKRLGSVLIELEPAGPARG